MIATDLMDHTADEVEYITRFVIKHIDENGRVVGTDAFWHNLQWHIECANLMFSACRVNLADNPAIGNARETQALRETGYALLAVCVPLLRRRPRRMEIARAVLLASELAALAVAGTPEA